MGTEGVAGIVMDFYRRRIAHAFWTWLESKVGRFYSKPRHKDRIMGRAEKRRARRQERRELEQEWES